MYSTLYMTVSFCNILLSRMLNTFRPELGDNEYIISVSNPANHFIAKAEHSFNTTHKLLWNLITAHTFIWVSDCCLSPNEQFSSYIILHSMRWGTFKVKRFAHWKYSPRIDMSPHSTHYPDSSLLVFALSL